jgi:hypothetical protein
MVYILSISKTYPVTLSYRHLIKGGGLPSTETSNRKNSESVSSMPLPGSCPEFILAQFLHANVTILP